MPESAVERRRWRRSVVPADKNEALDVGLSLTVRILDLSLTGAMLQAPIELFVGQRALISAVLSGHYFEVETEVRHIRAIERAPDRPPQMLIGVVFVSLNENHRAVIERFLPS
jgi:hypothetical protein